MNKMAQNIDMTERMYIYSAIFSIFCLVLRCKFVIWGMLAHQGALPVTGLLNN